MAVPPLFLPLLLSLVIGLRPSISLVAAQDSEDETEFWLVQRDSHDSPIRRNWPSKIEQIRSRREAGLRRAVYFYARIMNQEMHPTDYSEYINVQNGISNFHEYILKVYVSTNYQEQWLIYDTGSDLVWVQCKGCKPCFRQPNELFDITNSTSASIIPCSSCDDPILEDIDTKCSRNKCTFSYDYVDNSGLGGYLANETFSFAGNYQYDDIIFGCATSSKKMDGDPGGIAGFSSSPLSLPSQLSPSVGGNAFSSCLVRHDLNVGNKLTLGAKATAYSGVAYTPIVNPSSYPSTTYNLQVTQVMVGSTVLKIPSSTFNKGPGTMIDSGTTYIYLHKAAADPILKEVRRVVKKLPIVSSSDSALCYALKIKSVLDLNNYFPQITFVFKGNVNVKLLGYHYMDSFDDKTVCTIIFSTGNSATNLLGSYFQQDYLVVHDNSLNRVGFKPMNCATGTPR